MRRPLTLATAVVTLLACVAWAVFLVHSSGLDWAGFQQAWPYLLAGVLTVAAATGAAVWLAYFSERRGYDDRAGEASTKSRREGRVR